MKKYSKYMLTVIFITFIFAGCLFNMKSITSNLYTSLYGNNLITGVQNIINNFETSFNSCFYFHESCLNFNGLFNRTIGKKVVNNTIRDSEDNLYLYEDTEVDIDYETIDRNILYTKLIMEYAKEQDIECLYAQHPNKFDKDSTQLPYNKEMYEGQTDEYWYNEIKDDYDAIDLREDKYEAKEFYKTDHHWTNKSSLNASKAILEKWNMDAEIADISNYEVKDYGNAFLGSLGVKVGDWYVGKDDFSICIPKFATDLNHVHKVSGKIDKSTSGNFEDSFIDASIIEDITYKNKYNCFLQGGYVENIIQNNNASNDKKLLIISDSFARTMTMYISLGFAETRYIDPQEGRYNDSCIEYIKEYDPDYILVMYSLNYDEVMMDKDLTKYKLDL